MNIEIGMAVQWVEDPNYKGIVWEIHEREGTAYVEFLTPMCFTQAIRLDEIEPSGANKDDVSVISQAIADQTMLNAQQIEDLRQMYIELALATHDEDWFDALMDGSWMNE